MISPTLILPVVLTRVHAWPSRPRDYPFPGDKPGCIGKFRINQHGVMAGVAFVRTDCSESSTDIPFPFHLRSPAPQSSFSSTPTRRGEFVGSCRSWIRNREYCRHFGHSGSHGRKSLQLLIDSRSVPASSKCRTFSMKTIVIVAIRTIAWSSYHFLFPKLLNPDWPTDGSLKRIATPLERVDPSSD